ncbi:response regulator transcription factor [Oscillibacter sp. MSJ-2]|uniref:Response regulator transcription factor n=1 Tax=Dysosmobacter acutus TaxID=2841504 RepID=A0ABS6F8Z9_9FIRM|nr:response regulator transcription factor [Dysosmobacter acutus]MBU5626759.1 response regulator transcription factor [Dysosmobacter acutus]
MRRILVIEDEPDIQELLCAYLRDAGYEAAAAGDGVTALELFHKGSWDLLLLDLMLPKIDGYGVCELVRRESDVPIIMLTALDAEENQIKGFDLQADDYVTKPFSMPVLLRKIGAILRRSGGEERHTLSYAELLLDLDDYRASVDGTPVELTNREFELLRELVRNQGRVLTRSVLLGRLWNYDFLGDERIVDSHIKNLRRKLGRDYIETVRGVGYRIEKLH